MPDKPPRPIPVLLSKGNDSCANRILIDVIEGRYELAEAGYDHTLEAIVPNMTLNTEAPVVAKGENTQDPLHNLGQRGGVARSDHKMDMIIHYANGNKLE